MKEAKPETVKMVIKDDFGRTLLLEAPTPGHFCYITPNFANKFPESRGPLKVFEVADFPDNPLEEFSFLSQSVVDNLGTLTDGELFSLVRTGKPFRRN